MQSLRQWMSEGPFTLALSSSFFGFYAHCGILTALDEEGVRPSKISGSSAGALVGAAFASGQSMAEIQRLLFSVERSHFWDPWPGFGYLRGKKFLEFLRPHVGANFQDVGIPLEICAFDIFAGRTVFLDSGPLAEAVVASCAVPLMFHPVRLGRRYYADGGVFRKSGMKHEATDERILCIFLESKSRGRDAEWQKAKSNLSQNHKIVRFRELPAVHPLKMHLGHEAFVHAYRRAKGLIDVPFIGPCLES